MKRRSCIKGFLRRHSLWIYVALAGVGAYSLSHTIEYKREFADKQKVKQRKKELVVDLYNFVNEHYKMSDTRICEQEKPQVSASTCNFLLVHGYDSKPHLMRALKNDVRVWKQMVKSWGCDTVEICSDKHDRSTLEDVLAQLSKKSYQGGLTAQFYTAHGDKNGRILLNSDPDSSSGKSGSGESVITKKDLDRYMDKTRGFKEVYADTCYALPDLESGTQYNSSSPSHVSYFLPHHNAGDGKKVEMSYFTLAVAYTMAVRGNDYTLSETVRHLAERSSTLPKKVLQLMSDHHEAFKSITVRDNFPQYAGKFKLSGLRPSELWMTEK